MGHTPHINDLYIYVKIILIYREFQSKRHVNRLQFTIVHILLCVSVRSPFVVFFLFVCFQWKKLLRAPNSPSFAKFIMSRRQPVVEEEEPEAPPPPLVIEPDDIENNVLYVHELGLKDAQHPAPMDIDVAGSTAIDLPLLQWHEYERRPKKMRLTNSGRTRECRRRCRNVQYRNLSLVMKPEFRCLSCQSFSAPNGMGHDRT